eukprot:scaffold48999_cov58-Phaeocystis_antarctica.AAC.4
MACALTKHSDLNDHPPWLLTGYILPKNCIGGLGWEIAVWDVTRAAWGNLRSGFVTRSISSVTCTSSWCREPILHD